MHGPTCDKDAVEYHDRILKQTAHGTDVRMHARNGTDYGHYPICVRGYAQSTASKSVDRHQGQSHLPRRSLARHRTGLCC